MICVDADGLHESLAVVSIGRTLGRRDIVNDFAWQDEQPEMTDGTVSIRPWMPTDAPWVYRACQDPEVQRWTRVPIPYLLEHADGFVSELAPHKWSSGTGAAFAIVDSESDSGVGSVGLVGIDSVNRVAEAGYWMSEEGRGRGLTASALELLSSWSLTKGNLVRLELHIEVGNTPSRRVAEQSGFAFEGVMRKKALHRGEHRDLAMYSRIGN